MYHVYLLKSRIKNVFYIGFTNNISRRLKEHNNGLVEYTRKYIPWIMVYCETFVSLDDAKKREKALKYFGRAYGQLKRRIKESLNPAPFTITSVLKDRIRKGAG